eukprot:s71_g34.t1
MAKTSIRASALSLTGGPSERFTSRRSQLPRVSFSVDAVVQERFKKMIRFKRIMATYGLLNSDEGAFARGISPGIWCLTKCRVSTHESLWFKVCCLLLGAIEAMSLHSQFLMALLIATLLSLASAADTLQECRAGASGVCNRTAGSIFLQHHQRARRSDLQGVLASACSSSLEDCRDTGCCEDAGYTCFEKNQYWASCRQSCEPGEVNPNDDPEYRTPWTCTVVGGASTGTTTAGGTTTVVNPAPGRVLVTGHAGSGKARLFEFIAALTDQPVPGSQARAVHSSGGAAGGVVSESQGYGLLLSGALLAASPLNDPDRQKLMDYTYEMFLGWRRMCELSKDSGSCQEDEGFQCGGGQYPCLPHWKFDDDLTQIIGRGAAPDGDADALAGMLFAVLSLEKAGGTSPAWLDEVGQWAYDTCKQFYLSSTVSSSSGNHRIVKLGSCWGGWGSQGQNPSYHAPGVYRMKSHEGDAMEAEWNRLIATTYKMFDATQCESSGLIPNWAKVYEEG